MPVGTLIAEGIMPIINKDPTINNDAESVEAFFDKEYVRCWHGHVVLVV